MKLGLREVETSRHRFYDPKVERLFTSEDGLLAMAQPHDRPLRAPFLARSGLLGHLWRLPQERHVRRVSLATVPSLLHVLSQAYEVGLHSAWPHVGVIGLDA